MYDKNPNNHLKAEKSPYLQQHASNPVDWYPWCDEAFVKADASGKPVFLSIGYSTCHWCHIMAHESFENDEIAHYLNANYVSIKVDREERPDIDNIYMMACQIINGTGGWPLTVFMTPERRPFFAGTYFPPISRYGRIGLLELLKNITSLWETKREDLNKNADEISHYLRNMYNPEAGIPKDYSDELPREAYKHFEENYDKEWGGFGLKPKFPSPHNLMFLLRYWKIYSEPRALEMVSHTLIKMRMGGIYDHIGYGFHRYSTDREWLVPHFEKMLYDQALLLRIYTEAFQATKNNLFERTAKEIIEYLLRDMSSTGGGFYTAEDADSEGVEGKYYIWSLSEIKEILNPEDYEFARRIYNLKEEGNYQQESGGNSTYNNIIHLNVQDIGIGSGMDHLFEKSNAITNKLRTRRSERVRPLRDEKILTGLNGLIISSLAFAGRVFNNRFYVDTAKKTLEFIEKNLTADGELLLHSFPPGERKQYAFLDDYAYLIFGLIELFQSTMEPDYLEKALRFTRKVIEKHWDKEGKGFFDTSDKNEELIVRAKVYYDGAIPSGNSVMGYNLQRLSSLALEEEGDYLYGIYESNSIVLNKSPFTSTFLLNALMEHQSVKQISVRGRGKFDDKEVVYRALNESFCFNCVYRFFNVNEKMPGIFINNIPPESGYTYYVCQNKTCGLPTYDFSEILAGITNS